MSSSYEKIMDTLFAVGGFMWLSMGLFYLMAKIASNYSIFLMPK